MLPMLPKLPELKRIWPRLEFNMLRLMPLSFEACSSCCRRRRRRRRCRRRRRRRRQCCRRLGHLKGKKHFLVDLNSDFLPLFIFDFLHLG